MYFTAYLKDARKLTNHDEPAGLRAELDWVKSLRDEEKTDIYDRFLSQLEGEVAKLSPAEKP